MDSFNIISYFSVYLNALFHIIHIEKFTASNILIFFSLRNIFCVAPKRKKQIKNGGHHSHFIVKRQQRDNFRFK